jgi:hypothetical protein
MGVLRIIFLKAAIFPRALLARKSVMIVALKFAIA